MHGAKGNPIQRYNIKDPKKKTIAMTTSSFFGMSKDKALDFFGLATFCRKYGTVRDNVILSEDDDEFKDWHMQVNFGSETLNLLCFPDDLGCKNIVDETHSRT